jgi:hypothetical protein
MVVFGGLEIVAGGYLIHRYQKNKSEKKRLEAEAQQRRHNTFPSAKPQSYYPYDHQQQQQQQPVPLPQQKYACHAPQPQSQPHPQPLPQPQYYAPPRPQPMTHTQSFDIPRKPVPHPYQQQPPPIIIQPLQRADSFATLSRMPIANGYRPSDVAQQPPTLPPRQNASNLAPVFQSPYSHAGFSVSTPALGPAPLTPITPIHASPDFGRQTVDDNWETYAPQQGQQLGHVHHAPSESTALGEDNADDPPPPYVP